MIFGGFLEHFDNQIYGGVFEPGSALADEQGFRLDVIEALKELRVPVIRWPGGNFVSGYHWRDGVGPNRQAMPDPVWGVVDPNTFGTDEFVAWCRLAGCEQTGSRPLQHLQRPERALDILQQNPIELLPAKPRAAEPGVDFLQERLREVRPVMRRHRMGRHRRRRVEDAPQHRMKGARQHRERRTRTVASGGTSGPPWTPPRWTTGSDATATRTRVRRCRTP